MNAKGSVLVVVLGVLAILAIVGLTFMSMASVDRSTAAAFAMHTQMMIAADGAVDYVIHHLVNDVWRRDEGVQGGPFLMPLRSGDFGWTEPFDAATGHDPWLCSPLTTSGTPEAQFSYGNEKQTRRFNQYLGRPVSGTPTDTNSVDNLGLLTDPGPNGWWHPNLAAPFEASLSRTSVTVLDHAGLVNLNAHGNASASARLKAPDMVGLGYWISDVNPNYANEINMNALVRGGGTPSFGRWGMTGEPGIAWRAATIIENPQGGTTFVNFPFSLAEEFELRYVDGTTFVSRIEKLFQGGMSWRQRLNHTTVGWTAEVRGDGTSGARRVVAEAEHWSRPKADVNLALLDDLYEALVDGRAIAGGDRAAQFVANLAAFRSKKSPHDVVTVDGEQYVGADRQPVLSKIVLTTLQVPSEGVRGQYKVDVQVVNPWPGDFHGDSGLSVGNIKIEFDGVGHTASLSGNMGDGDAAAISHTFTVEENSTLEGTLDAIRMHKEVGGRTLDLDEASGEDINRLAASNTLYRPIDWENEKRGSGGGDIRVVYIGPWTTGGSNDPTQFTRQMPSVKIPIRFPKSVPDAYNAATAGPLPFRPTGAAGDFAAVARLGDLNQLLTVPKAGSGSRWWDKPWVVTVSNLGSESGETDVKWNWADTEPSAFGTSRALAANVLTTWGPWNDGLDNDGDGVKDDDDPGTPEKGWRGGPEFRVAGKVNLNTVTQGAFRAVADGVDVPMFWNDLRSQRRKDALWSPAHILWLRNIQNGIPNPPDARGYLERRDIVYTRLSNLASVRSDTYSVYGTVQLGDIQQVNKFEVRRSRRFWALIDRSASLAYPPGHKAFHEPRIMTFQWID
jgi:hypothetical protein